VPSTLQDLNLDFYMIDARENYNDFNSLEMISASSRADVNAKMNKSAIDDIPPPDTYLPIIPKRPDSIQNTKCYKSHYVTIHK